jgi:hypothetical protein
VNAPLIASANVAAAPVSSIIGALFALPAFQGLASGTVPHTTQEWVSFGFQIGVGLLGLFGR